MLVKVIWTVALGVGWGTVAAADLGLVDIPLELRVHNMLLSMLIAGTVVFAIRSLVYGSASLRAFQAGVETGADREARRREAARREFEVGAEITG